jgi:hypothetical protein
MFKVLPPAAHTIRVGLANTAARYYLGNHTAVRKILREMSGLAAVRPTETSMLQKVEIS